MTAPSSPAAPRIEPPSPALRPLVVDWRTLPVVNAAIQHIDVPVVNDLVIKNPNPVEVGPVHVRIAMDPPIAPPWERTIQYIKAGEELDFDEADIRLELSPERLANQLETEHGHMRLTVRTPDDTRELTAPLAIQSFNEWLGPDLQPESMACFVQPNHPALVPVINAAHQAIAAATGRASLEGYQSGPERAAQIAAAVWAAAQSFGIRYINPPASFERYFIGAAQTGGQKILLPDQVLGDKMGTCLDLTVFLAALLERAGLHPLLLVIRGHAFPGVLLRADDQLSSAVTDDVTEITKRVEAGTALVFDSSDLADGVAFNHACGKAAVQFLATETFRLAIDVAYCRNPRFRVLPLPIRTSAFSLAAGAPEPVARPGALAVPPLPVRVADDRPLSKDLGPQTPAARRLARWKGRLLDLSLRNPLLNFREGRRNLPLVTHDIAALEDALAAREAFALMPAEADGLRSQVLFEQRTGASRALEVARDLLAKRVLVPDLPPADAARRIVELYRTARTLAEETGSTGAWLALGFIEWFETSAAREARRAPILLLPVEIVRGNAREPFKLRLADDEPRINSTLLKKLELDFGLDVTGYDELPEDDAGLDVPLIFARFRKLVETMPRCQVLERAAVGFFSFTKHMMWLDLEARTEALLQNPVVRHLAGGEGKAFPLARPFVPAQELDLRRPPGDDLAVLEADSSQLVAVQGAVDGNTFVLEGPPGTGKSQTITNLVAELLGRSQSVLFVAEKRAAIEVVKDRLDKVGLGAFCLDLHAHDATKLEVLEQIAAPLELARLAPSHELQRKGAELGRLRGELAIVWSALHAPGPAGVSAWQAVSRLDELGPEPRVQFDFDADGPLEEARWEAMKVAVCELGWAGQAVPRPTEHAFAASQLSDWDARRQTHVARSLEAVTAAHTQLASALGEVERRTGLLPRETDRDALGGLGRLLDVLTAAPRVSRELVEVADDPNRRRRLGEVTTAQAARAAGWNALSPRWHEGLLALDTARLEARFSRWHHAFFLVAFVMLFMSRRSLAKVARGPLGRNAEIARDLAAAGDVKRAGAIVAERRDEAELVLGPASTGLASLTAEVGDAVTQLAWCDRYHETRRRDALALRDGALLAGLPLPLPTPSGAAARSFLAAHATFEGALVALEGDLELGRDLFARASLGAIAEEVGRFQLHLRELRDWAQWMRARKAAVALGLAPFVRAFEGGAVPADGLEVALERSAMAWRIEDAMAREPALARFRGSEHEARSRAFRALDEERQKLAARAIIERLVARLPDATFEGGEIGVLKGELRKKRRHLPLRKLFAKIPTILPRLKPCVFMSPMSVAQYLDPALGLFDVVVFDEASQIPPWDAIGALGRGRRAIIVGDSKQMPPTSFFSKADDDEAPEDELEEMESILDECDRSGLPKLSLKWHYRSKHPSLIQFSNHRYYDSQLVTFPAAAAEVPTLGVKWLPVDGVYDKGQTRANKIEAEVVVGEVLRRLTDPALAAKSLGVVTFAMPQKTLIENRLDEERQKNPALEAFFDPKLHPEPVFIKNLENVQGDERDVILFSMSYGPDKDNKVALNFGALNRAGGERRLNVAVTRAREALVVVSSLRPEHIADGRTNAIGVRHLREFLAFAQRGGSGTMADEVLLREQDTAGCVQVISQRLGELGYSVDRNVGAQGPRVDIAVRDPERPGSYLLGIVSDGPVWGRFPSVRDREKLGPAVLERQGWRLHRLWSLDWWHDPERELGRIVERLSEAGEAARKAHAEPLVPTGPAPAIPPAAATAPPPTPVGPGPAAPPTPKQIAASAAPRVERGKTDPVAWLATQRGPGVRYQAVPYVRGATPLLADRLPAEDPRYHGWVAGRVIQIVEEEGPIHHEEAIRRAFDSWEVRRVGAKMSQGVRDQLRWMPEAPRLIGDFFWPRHLDPATWTSFRQQSPEDEDRRGAESIPPEEVANAASAVLSRALGIERGELLTQLALVFGIGRRGAKVDDHFQRALDLLVATGRATIEGTMYRWVERG